ncbi:Leucine-rich repeat-containing G-protein coupled receptor 4 [Anthophora retusa]
MANYLKISLIVVCTIVLLQMVNTAQQVSFVRKCKGIDHTIYLKRSSVLNCPEEETVNLSGLNLPTIPKNFVRSSTIENILLDRNKIRVIPTDAFKFVPKLKCLNLSRNKIPYELLTFEQPSLKTLILDYETNYLHASDDMSTDNIWDLSKISSNFPNLEILSIRGNKVTSVNIPSESFPQLSTLYLSDNDIQYVDPFIFQNHPQLRNVHLERNNIESLNLEDVSNLEELYLDRNPIKYIDVSSLNQSLKVLSVSNCSLENLNVYSTLLITLDMSRNQIDYIFDNQFQNVSLLENLNLMYNDLTWIPNLSYLKQLKRLFLGYNKISGFLADSIPHGLKILSLKGNQIKEFYSMGFQDLKTLEELDLSFNKLESLPTYWNEDFKMLRHLNLMSNRFTTIGDMNIGGLTNLKELCVANNFIGSIDLNSLQTVPQECTVGVLSGTYLKSWSTLTR